MTIPIVILCVVGVCSHPGDPVSKPSSDGIWIECERFRSLGGWKCDSQFRLEMGSTYLLAHGLGKPVEDAVTEIEVDVAARYRVWARTKNWTAKWSKAEGAGRFQVAIDGKLLPKILGATGNGGWEWVDAGEIELLKGQYSLALHDLTGFDGRCDAIVLLPLDRPPPKDGNSRRDAVDSKSATIRSDLTVIGGGIAGICTAISAARLGLKVSLVQDRPMLGGANSSEIRVHLGGYQNLGKYPRLGDVVSEIGPAHGGNAMPAENYEDSRKLAVVENEKNIRLFLNTMVEKVVKRDNDRIGEVVGYDVRTGRATRFASPLFVDCTGDGTVGYLAGADYRLGREAKSETGEDMAPENADRMTMGASVQWYAKQEDAPVKFPRENWMIPFRRRNCEYAMRGDWNWETGMNHDQLGDFETVRDYGMLVVYSNWAGVKNHRKRKELFECASLDWVAYIAGKRETRRLMGDHVLCQQDIFEERQYPDGTCCTTWAIDLHYPMSSDQSNFDGEPFRSYCTHNAHYAYPIPYRCFYSRNIRNLFMAGRDISVTHVALGTTRVMRTHGMQGEVVGMAASLCKKHDCLPRDIYLSHLDDLKALMARGVGLGKAQPPQNYNCGEMKTR